ncbi:MAG: cytochrome C [Burkholderiaceae bacterium]|nr:cytochrome C [Burkholderiaceae bacterium]
MMAAPIATIVRAGGRHAVRPCSVLAGLLVVAGAASAQSRGELLYTTHCIACHDKQVHWRDQRRATDLNSLREQVRLWQGRAHLSWTEDDIAEVTRHLNQSIYRFAQPTARAPHAQDTQHARARK